MNKCINNPIAISTALREWKERESVTQMYIESRTGLDQSSVSRILSGHFSTANKSVLKICKLANIIIIKPTIDPTTNQRLMQALEKTWDGTTRHANMIAKVIRALDRH